MKRLLPVILAIIGLAVGTGAGIYLKPKPVDGTATAAAGKSATKDTEAKNPKAPSPPDKSPALAGENAKAIEPDTASGIGREYVKLNNQFIVPVIKGAKVAALVVLSLSIEVTAGKKGVVYDVEPKLRDAFLQVLFNHANSGGFDGEFTSGEKMKDLRGSLSEAAVKILGPIATDVLVTDIVRQDIS